MFEQICALKGTGTFRISLGTVTSIVKPWQVVARISTLPSPTHLAFGDASGHQSSHFIKLLRLYYTTEILLSEVFYY